MDIRTPSNYFQMTKDRDDAQLQEVASKLGAWIEGSYLEAIKGHKPFVLDIPVGMLSTDNMEFLADEFNTAWSADNQLPYHVTFSILSEKEWVLTFEPV